MHRTATSHTVLLLSLFFQLQVVLKRKYICRRSKGIYQHWQGLFSSNEIYKKLFRFQLFILKASLESLASISSL